MTPADTDLSPLADAIGIIDRGLRDIQQRQIIPSNEVADLLLDLRLLLLAHEVSHTSIA
jgi:hypothetical protein